MIAVRRADERGHAHHGWLDTHHTFSFASYHDPEQMGFRALRVINEDRVAPGAGFPPHPHQDMEIVSYVISGGLEHRDSMGNGSVIRAGEFQRMTAGKGVTHSEFNASRTRPVHFLQIWVEPAEKGLAPGYEQRAFPESERRNRLRLVASPSGNAGSLTVHQDILLYTALLDRGQRLEYTLEEGRHAWVQIVSGEVAVNGHALSAGDGASLSLEARISFEIRKQDTELLLFDLA